MFTAEIDDIVERYMARNRILNGGWALSLASGATTVSVTGAAIQRMQAGLAKTDIATGAVTTARGNKKAQQKANSTCYYALVAVPAGTFKLYKGLDNVDRFPAELYDAMLDDEIIVSIFKVVTSSAWTVLEDNWGAATVTACNLAGCIPGNKPSELTYAAASTTYWRHAFGVDDATGVPAPETGDALVPITGVLGVSALGVYRVSGVPAVALVELTEGPPYRIRGSLKTAPTGAAFIYLAWCCDNLVSSGYALEITATAWSLVDITSGVATPLDTFSTAPANGDTFEITVTDAGLMAVSINGAEQLSGTDTDHLALLNFGFAFTGDGAIGLYSDNYFTVDNGL